MEHLTRSEICVLSHDIENSELTNAASIIIGDLECYDEYGSPSDQTACLRAWIPPNAFSSDVEFSKSEKDKLIKITHAASKCKSVAIELMCCRWFSANFDECRNFTKNFTSFLKRFKDSKVIVRSSDFSNEAAISIMPYMYGKEIWSQIEFSVKSDVVGTVIAFSDCKGETNMPDVDMFCKAIGSEMANITALPSTRRMIFKKDLPEWARVIIKAQYDRDDYDKKIFHPLMVKFSPPTSNITWVTSVTHFCEINDFKAFHTDRGIERAYQIIENSFGKNGSHTVRLREMMNNGTQIDEIAQTASSSVKSAIVNLSPT